MSYHLSISRPLVETATALAVQPIAYDELGNVVNDTNPGFPRFGFGGGRGNLRGINSLPATLVGLGSLCAGYTAGKAVSDWKDPIGVQESLALVEDQVLRINERLESPECDSLTTAQLLEARNRLAKVKLDLAGTLGGGNLAVDLGLNALCDTLIGLGFYRSRLPLVAP